MVANQPCSWSAQQGKIFFPCPLVSVAPENLVSIDRFGRPVPRQSTHSPHSGCIWCITHENPPTFQGGVHACIPSTAIESVPSSSVHANAYRLRSLPRVHWHRASSPQGSSSNGCCLFRPHHGPFFCAPLFSHAHCTTVYRVFLFVCSIVNY